MIMIVVIVSMFMMIVVVSVVMVVIMVMIMSMIVGVAVDRGVVMIRIPGGVFSLAGCDLDPKDRFDIAAGIVAVGNDQPERTSFGGGERAAVALIDQNAVFKRVAKGDARCEFPIFRVECDMIGFGKRIRFFEDRLYANARSFHSRHQSADVVDLVFLGKTRELLVSPLLLFLNGSFHG